MNTIRPLRSRSIPFAARRATRNEPVRLVWMTASQSSSDIRSSSVSRVMPAFATSTSTGPCLLRDRVERRVDLLLVGDVALHPEEAVRRRTRVVGDRDLVAGLLERGRDRQTDPPATTGHQHRPAHKPSSHRRSEERYPTRPGSPDLGVFEPEADFHADLVVVDLVVHYVAADLGDLEPIEVPQGLAGPGDAVQ